MQLSRTDDKFAVMMRGAAAAARIHRERVSRRVEDEWSEFTAGNSPRVADLMSLVEEVSARTAARTREGMKELRQADTRLFMLREAWQKASRELRVALRDLKHIMEAAYGKTPARHFLGIPPTLPPEYLLIETAAASASTRLADASIPLPRGGAGLNLDRAYWAREIGGKLERARQTREALMDMRRIMIEKRDDRNREMARRSRQGRAAWLILKGLLLFNDEPTLLEDLNSMRRPRRRSGSEDVTLDEQASPAIQKNEPENGEDSRVAEEANIPREAPQVQEKTSAPAQVASDQRRENRGQTHLRRLEDPGPTPHEPRDGGEDQIPPAHGGGRRDSS